MSSRFVNAFLRLYNFVLPADSDPVDFTKTPPTTNLYANIICKIIGFNSYVDANNQIQYLYDYPIIDTSRVPTTIILAEIFSSPANYNYEVMQFSTDNVSPFVYSGSITSQNQPVGHEMTLNSLTLPNVPLSNGGRIAYYPYVYVELENVSASGRNNNNLIYSNNPYTHKVMFKVPITDLNHPRNSPFVKLTGNGMNQTVTFKQNDNVRVSVKLPSGKLFEAVSQDSDYGQAPNPFLQISFCFGMKRI